MDKIQGDPNVSLLSGRLKGTYNQRFDDCLNKNFGEGRALFWMGGMKVLEWYRDYEVDFGLLPTPKLSESQDRFYCSYSTGNLTAYSVPLTNPDYERTGIITEAMAALSQSTLTPAYYDITLKGKALRDEESIAMLDLVLNSRHYDMGATANWGGMFNSIRNEYATFTSSFASMETATRAAIEAFINSLK